ncbi:hypothetical protein H5410_044815 [Solanum commersonii]|uniref:FAS1 domain-containing protein n=1 Tax=Solanum commersonii TaxID=4109 RepID=A0A9J5XA10_SOLCO|nr:hypothetical protein H5410_044815 [Solanum commersonii]
MVQVVEDQLKLDWPSSCKPKNGIIHCSCDGLWFLEKNWLSYRRSVCYGFEDCGMDYLAFVHGAFHWLGPSPSPTPPPARAMAPAPGPPGPTNDNASTFIRLLQTTQEISQITSLLNNSNSITIFVPPDNAFLRMKAGTLNSFNDQQKSELIKFHVLPQYFSLSQFQTASNPVQTQAGGTSNREFPINITTNGISVNITTGIVNASISNTIYIDSQLAIYQVDKHQHQLLHHPKPKKNDDSSDSDSVSSVSSGVINSPRELLFCLAAFYSARQIEIRPPFDCSQGKNASSPAPAPAPGSPPPLNVTKILEKAGQCSTFIRLLQNTQQLNEITSQLNNSNNGITMFVPTDNAFLNMKAGTLNSFTDQQKAELIQFHILPTYYSLTQFQTASNPLRTQAGGTTDREFPINITTIGSSVNITTGIVNASISNTIYTDNQLAIYQVDNVLLPLQFFVPPAPAPAPTPITRKKKAGSSDSSSKQDASSATSLFQEMYKGGIFLFLFSTAFFSSL